MQMPTSYILKSPKLNEVIKLFHVSFIFRSTILTTSTHPNTRKRSIFDSIFLYFQLSNMIVTRHCHYSVHTVTSAVEVNVMNGDM